MKKRRTRYWRSRAACCCKSGQTVRIGQSPEKPQRHRGTERTSKRLEIVNFLCVSVTLWQVHIRFAPPEPLFKEDQVKFRFFVAALLLTGAFLISPSPARAQEGEPVVIDEVIAQVNDGVVTLSQLKRQRQHPTRTL